MSRCHCGPESIIACRQRRCRSRAGQGRCRRVLVRGLDASVLPERLLVEYPLAVQALAPSRPCPPSPKPLPIPPHPRPRRRRTCCTMPRREHAPRSCSPSRPTSCPRSAPPPPSAARSTPCFKRRKGATPAATSSSGARPRPDWRAPWLSALRSALRALYIFHGRLGLRALDPFI